MLIAAAIASCSCRTVRSSEPVGMEVLTQVAKIPICVCTSRTSLLMSFLVSTGFDRCCFIESRKRTQTLQALKRSATWTRLANAADNEGNFKGASTNMTTTTACPLAISVDPICQPITTSDCYTPVNAVQNAVYSTIRILDRKLQDFQSELAIEEAHKVHDDDASIQQEMDDLTEWQDRIQAEMLDLDTSWSDDLLEDEEMEINARTVENDAATIDNTVPLYDDERPYKVHGMSIRHLISMEIECDTEFGVYRDRILEVVQSLSFQDHHVVINY